MKWKFIIPVIILLSLTGGYALKTYRDAGEFKTITPHFDGTKALITGVTGAEDITIDFRNQIAYISSDDRFATLHGHKTSGGIFTLDLKGTQTGVAHIALTLPGEIHPHGISFYRSQDSLSYLYVVDHTGGKHSILKLKGFQFEKQFRDSVFIISPNDVLAVDENRFYFTNDHGSLSATGKKLEEFLQLKKSNVVYYDGEKYSIAAEGIAYANGINMSTDGKEVYVASTIGGSVLVYARDVSSGKLSFKEEIRLQSGADNIEIDEQGNLWVACHPKLLTFVKHANDTSKLSPSQVFKITHDSSGKFTAQEIFLSEGDDLSGSSVAAVTGNLLLIGSVLDEGILQCRLK